MRASRNTPASERVSGRIEFSWHIMSKHVFTISFCYVKGSKFDKIMRAHAEGVFMEALIWENALFYDLYSYISCGKSSYNAIFSYESFQKYPCLRKG